MKNTKPKQTRKTKTKSKSKLTCKFNNCSRFSRTYPVRWLRACACTYMGEFHTGLSGSSWTDFPTSEKDPTSHMSLSSKKVKDVTHARESSVAGCTVRISLCLASTISPKTDILQCVCDVWQVQRKTHGYLPGEGALSPTHFPSLWGSETELAFIRWQVNKRITKCKIWDSYFWFHQKSIPLTEPPPSILMKRRPSG